MGRIDVVIPDDLEIKVRARALKDFGGKKGSLQSAVEAALKQWVGEAQ
jgi:hypothetical protein